MKNLSEIKMSSNKSFGITFSVVFLIIAIWPLINYEQIRIWSIIISLIFLFLGLINSNFLSTFNKLWFKFGILLGSIVAPFAMGTVFFVVVTPIGILMRLFRKDILKKKINDKEKSYWIYRDKTKSSMKNQF